MTTVNEICDASPTAAGNFLPLGGGLRENPIETAGSLGGAANMPRKYVLEAVD